MAFFGSGGPEVHPLLKPIVSNGLMPGMETPLKLLQPLSPSAVVRAGSHLLLFALRGFSTVAKFVLALYTARYLGLSELGVYGLVAAATGIVPAVLGFGLTDWVARQVVVSGKDEALQKISARLAISILANLSFQPVFWIACLALGAPILPERIWLIAPIILFEHLALEVHDLLIARGHNTFTSVLQFIRAALWPIVVVTIGFLYPQTRTLENILLAWLLGLGLMFTIFTVWLLWQQSGPLVRFAEMRTQIGFIRRSLPLYMRDVATKSSLFLDRYLISLTLGLELTGVYVFFWSVASAMHGMVISVVGQPQAPKLIAAAARNDVSGFRQAQRKLRLETTAWTILLMVAAFVAVWILLPYLQRPALAAHFAVFPLILLAGCARVGADQYGFVLLALHRDRDILAASLTGVAASALLNIVLIPTCGIWGAALAFLLTGLIVLALEVRIINRVEISSLPPT